MRFKLYISLLLGLCSVVCANAQHKKDNMPRRGDSIITNRTYEPTPVINEEGTERFYDSLSTKASRGAVSKLLYNAFFRTPRRDTLPEGSVVDEMAYYNRFEGKEIGSVTIIRYPIYDNDDNGFERAVNKTHRLTRTYVIRRDLFFKQGDTVDPYEIVGNKYLLMNRDYLSKVDIDFIIRNADTMVVDAVVTTTDRLTLALDGSWKSDGRTMVEVFDESMFGTGNKLSVKTNFDRKKWNYEGNSFEYYIPNILGTFYKGEFEFGREFYDRIMEASIYKDFFRVNDYDLGFSFKKNREEYTSLPRDEVDSVKEQRIEAWTGKSFYFRRLKTSIYLTGMFGSARFDKRPEVAQNLNPYFHESDYMYFGLGVFRENFYRTNMIYGYGRREYLPEGFKAELLGGYSWGEFNNEYYVGARLHRAKFHRWGYFRSELEYGSYIDKNGDNWRRSVAKFNLQWISNLLRTGGSDLRQFVTFNYTRGWNRMEGDQEVLEFTKDAGPRTMNDWIVGLQRIALSTETVVFTPLEPWGFRMAVFGFCDFAFLGNNSNPFDNSFYTTLGAGVRFKNERFVFRTLELRLGVALTKGGFINNDYIRISSEQRLRRNRLNPEYPSPIEFD